MSGMCVVSRLSGVIISLYIVMLGIVCMILSIGIVMVCIVVMCV